MQSILLSIYLTVHLFTHWIKRYIRLISSLLVQYVGGPGGVIRAITPRNLNTSGVILFGSVTFCAQLKRTWRTKRTQRNAGKALSSEH